MHRSLKAVCCTAFLSLGLANLASAQVSTINSVKIFPREFNDDPTSNLTVVNNYPTLISFDDESVDKNGQTGGFANRHVWRFSSNNGSSAFKFTNDTFFEVYMTLTLTGNATPRKEAGFIFDTQGGQGQFIVDSDAHEVVMFGGPFTFYAFPSTFHIGDTIRLGMTYFKDTDGKRKIIYHAGTADSPPQTFDNLEHGIINNTTLGGYLQVDIDHANPNNGAKASFANISIIGVANASGTITLEGCQMAEPITFEFRPTDNTPSFTRTVTIAANGTFTVTAVPMKTYQVAIKGPIWLQKDVNLDMTHGDVSNLNASLTVGDINGDNFIDIDDLGQLAYAFGTQTGDAKYNPNADLNCDGFIDIDDLGLFSFNYGKQGDQ